MRKKVFLETDEYDIFMFPVPETVLKGNRFLITIFPRKSMKEWVLSWMQRLHPCFDGRFVHDIRFYKEKGRVMALVTVADKMHVAAHLEKKNTALYVYRPDKRRVFAGNVSTRRFWLASAFAFVFAMVSLSGFALYSDNRMPEIMPVQPPFQDNPPENLDFDDKLPDFSNVLQSNEITDEICVEPEDAVQQSNIQPVVLEIVRIDNSEADSENVEILVQMDKTESLAQCEEKQLEFIDDTIVTEPESILITSDDENNSFDSPYFESPCIKENISICDTPYIDDFISLLIESGCRISNFRWQMEPFVSAVIAVDGCFPEEVYDCAVKLCGGNDFVLRDDLPQLSFSSISYTNNVPSFSIILDYSRFETTAGVVPMSADELQFTLSRVFFAADSLAQSFFPAQSVFRKLIVKNGGSVISENMEPSSVYGRIPYERWNEFSEEVAHIIETEQVRGITSVSLDTVDIGSYGVNGNLNYDASAEERTVSVDLLFDSNQISFFPLEHISVLFPKYENTSSLQETFLSEQSFSAEQEQPTAPELSDTQPNIAFINLKEIGQVCMGGNVYVNFYRNGDGTIIKGEPYEKE